MILASMRLNKNAHKDDRIKSFQNTDVLAKLLEIDIYFRLGTAD